MQPAWSAAFGDRGRPRTHREWGEALDALRSARAVAPVTAERMSDAARPAAH
ncbi:hypothetical protein OG618_35655 [Kitasatospora sp. NBC_01246]|uniref:hypothetical protein n=1 Tax=Kitasatospora sp. NBC_01246 TaxID=2903570 RepID=UPI002E2FBA0D|nr:hypothetical protein [Kitasatospora sp. NBC_01246]